MNKRRFIFGMVLCLCILIVAIPATAFGQNYEVAVNQSQVLNIEGVKRVAIANPSIADVLVVSDSELLLVGKAPGGEVDGIFFTRHRCGEILQFIHRGVFTPAG